MSSLTLAEQAQRDQRRMRFKEESKRGAPPLPKRQFAHPEKLVKSDADACVAKLLARKMASGVSLTADQRRALETIQANGTSVVESAAATPLKPPVTVVAPARGPVAAREAPPAKPAAIEQPSKRVLTLRKKLHEIADLERREAEEGAVLQANQKQKVATKAALAAELASLS